MFCDRCKMNEYDKYHDFFVEDCYPESILDTSRSISIDFTLVLSSNIDSVCIRDVVQMRTYTIKYILHVSEMYMWYQGLIKTVYVMSLFKVYIYLYYIVSFLFIVCKWFPSWWPSCNFPFSDYK